MINLKDFKYTDSHDINVYFVNCAETPYSRKQLLSEMSTYTKFMERFDCSLDELCEILDMYGVQDKDLFEYTVTRTNYPIATDYIYTSKIERDGSTWREKKTYYNVYLTVNQFVSLRLNTVATEIVKRHFHYLTLPPFTSVEKRFNDNIKYLPKTLRAKVKDIDHSILFDNDLTIGDLIKLYTEDNYANSEVEKPLFATYSDGSDIFITLDKDKGGWTLGLKFQDLANKDWKAIEDRHVFSICLYDKKGEQVKGKWFEGKQKDAPYFNHPLVKELKKILTE